MHTTSLMHMKSVHARVEPLVRDAHAMFSALSNTRFDTFAIFHAKFNAPVCAILDARTICYAQFPWHMKPHSALQVQTPVNLGPTTQFLGTQQAITDLPCTSLTSLSLVSMNDQENPTMPRAGGLVNVPVMHPLHPRLYLQMCQLCIPPSSFICG